MKLQAKDFQHCSNVFFSNASLQRAVGSTAASTMDEGEKESGPS